MPIPTRDFVRIVAVVVLVVASDRAGRVAARARHVASHSGLGRVHAP
jgi:hypothetical protein